ncbi:MAG: alpha/beta hydrolase [Deltaproteobacteria bacterium]|nr:alpha/beta hydrolase [Deltaproteobacteria bacterium]
MLEILLDAIREFVHVVRARLRRGPLRQSWSFTTELGVGVLRRIMKRSMEHDIPWLREVMDRAPQTDKVLRSVRFEEVDAGGVRALWCRPAGRPAPGRTLLYFHGGGYVLGSPEGHRELIAHLAIEADAQVLAPDYRLAPEHRFPAAQEDAIAAYRWLLDSGVDPGHLAVGGDSAGGGLSVATLLQARNAGDALPAAAVLVSPWVDPFAEGGSMSANVESDYLDREVLVRWIEAHLGSADPDNPLVCNANADLAGLPPLFVLWGGAEVLCDQIRAFVERAQGAGVDVTPLEWEHMFHDWVAARSLVRDAAPATARLADFLRRRVKPAA